MHNIFVEAFQFDGLNLCRHSIILSMFNYESKLESSLEDILNLENVFSRF